MKSVNLQDAYLGELKTSKLSVTLVTTNGFQMKGSIVLGFDNYAIMLRFDNRDILVFKHAVSSIMPESATKLILNLEKEE